MRQDKTVNQKCQGFTLLTMMVALAALTILAGLVSNMAMATFGHHPYNAIDRKDIYLFFAETQEEMKSAQNLQCYQGGITFELYGNTIDYKLIGTNIRRQVNGNGYEIVLKKAQSVTFQYVNQVTTILLKDTSGRPYQWAVKNMVQ